MQNYLKLQKELFYHQEFIGLRYIRTHRKAIFIQPEKKYWREEREENRGSLNQQLACYQSLKNSKKVSIQGVTPN